MAKIDTAPTPEEVVEALTRKCYQSSYGSCGCGKCVDGLILNDEGKTLAALFLKELKISVSTD